MHQHRIIRGFAALIVLTGLLAGVPAALIALSGNPFPPDVETLTHVLISPDIGGTFLMGTVVPLLAWGAWGYLVICVVAEGIDLVRSGRRQRRSTRSRNPGRRLASSLLTAVVLMIGGSVLVAPAHATPISDPSNAIASANANANANLTLSEAPTDDSSHDDAEVPQSAVSMDQRSITVREGDSLWGLAAAHLGEGSRYPEIAALNQGIPQTDGGALDDDLWLTPGWNIVLPPDTGRSGHEVTDEPASIVGTPMFVESGDTLWSLAHNHLGDASRFVEIAHASGIDPATPLYPGDVLIMPPGASGMVESEADDAPLATGEQDESGGSVSDEVASGISTVPANPVPTSTSTPVDTAGSATVANGAEPAEHAPSATNATSAWSGLASSSGPTSASAGAEESADESDSGITAPQVAGVDLQTVGGVGGALAAGMLGWVAVRRMLQRRRRRPGERIAMPDLPAAAVEEQLRAVDGTAASLTLDHALRFLAGQAQETAESMPPVVVARATDDEITFYLDGSAELSPPFLPVADDGSGWTIQAHDLPRLDRIPSAPCPSLVSIGNDATGALVFVDLERVGTLGVTGEDVLVRASLLATSLELATSPWGDDLRVTLVGFDDRLTDELASGRIRHVSDIGSLCDELAAHQGHVRRALDEIDAASRAEARTLGPDAESWVVDVVIVGSPLPEAARQRLLALAERESGVGVAIVFGSMPSEGWRLELHAADDASLVLPGERGQLDLDPQLLGEPDYEHLIELARVTGSAAIGFVEARSNVEDWTLSLPPIDTEQLSAPALDDVNSSSVAAASIHVDAESVDATSVHEVAPTLIAPGTEAAHLMPLPDDEAAWNAALDELAPEIEAAKVELARSTLPAASPPSTRSRRRRATGDRMVDGLDAAARALISSLADRPWVRILGPVELKNAAGSPPITPHTNTVNNSTIKRATELTAYLALHPGASTEQFHAAFWPGKDPRGKSAASNRNGLATRARKWLGSAPDGSPYFPHVGSHGYRLHDAVTTDWHVFLELVGDDLGTTPVARLRAALDFVQGQPFAGVKERFYGWAEVTRMDMLATIGDACHELATRAIREGDAATARTSAALGREIDPINETSWRDALQAELLAGDHDGFDRIVGLLTTQLDDFEDGYEPEFETQELIDLGRGARSSPHEPAEAQR